MILVTVGSQLPFDRLIHAVAGWAQERGRGDVFAQVGEGGARPEGLECVETLEPSAFQGRLDGAELVIGHAGTGTIMGALMAGKRVVCLARREALGETRNDHQVATVERLTGRAGFSGTADEGGLGALIDAALAGESAAPAPMGSGASPELRARLGAFLERHVARADR